MNGATYGLVAERECDASARQKQFRHWFRPIAEEAARETAVVFYGRREVRDGKASLVEAEDGKTLVTAGKGILKDDGVIFSFSSDCNIIQRVIFHFGAGGCAVFFLVELANGEDFEPFFQIRFDSVDNLERRNEFAAEAPRELVQHGGRVGNVLEPKLRADLILGDVGSSQLDESASSTLNGTIGGLAASVCRDNKAFILFVYPTKGGTTY